MVYTERAEMAAVSSGTSHVRTQHRCSHTTWVYCIPAKRAVKKRQTFIHLESHMMQLTLKSAVSLLQSREYRYIKAINNNSWIVTIC